MSPSNLTTEEISWVISRMDVYTIPYQEVYNEVLDHILSAIEQARANGDVQPIETLFQVVVDNHFNGYVGIEEIVQMQEKAYKHQVHRVFWQNYRSILDWKALLFIAIAVCLTHLLPGKIIISKAAISVTLIVQFIPLIYIYISTRIIKVRKGKKSLIRRHLMLNGFIPFMVLNGFFNIPNTIDSFSDNKSLHGFILNHPEVAVLLMALSLIYTSTSIYMCKQELKSYKLNY